MGSSVGTLQPNDLSRRFKKEQYLPEVLSMVNFDGLCDSQQTVSIDELIKALSEKTDVFLSHNQGNRMENHNLVSVISAGLKARGIITYCDSRLIFHEGVMIDNARCSAIFVTGEYESKIVGNNEFDCCKLEFRHALQTKTAAFMIPIVMEATMCDSGTWKDPLKTMLDPSQPIIDMSIHDHAHLETKIDELYKVIVATVKIPLLALLEKQLSLLGCSYSGSINIVSPHASPTHMTPTVLWEDIAKSPAVTSSLIGECVMTLSGHSDAVVGLIQMSDGRLCSCSEDCNILLWDLSEGTHVASLSGHTGVVHCVIQLTGLLLCSCGEDWLIKVWDTRTHICMKTLTGHTGGVWSVLQMSDCRICSASADHSIMIWNMGTDTCDTVLTGHTGPVFGVIQLADDRLCSCSMDKTIKVLHQLPIAYTHTHTDTSSLYLHVSPMLISFFPPSPIPSYGKIWDIRSNTCVMTLTGHQQFVRSVVQLSDGRICSGSLDKSIMIWDLNNGSCVLTLNGHAELVKSVIQLSDGRICSASWDHTCMIWDLTSGLCVLSLVGHTRAVRTVIQLSDGRICTGGADNVLMVWK